MHYDEIQFLKVIEIAYNCVFKGILNYSLLFLPNNNF